MSVEPSTLVAFVTAGSDTGPILGACGDFYVEIENGGYDIADHNLPVPTESGLAVFEGWIEVHGPDFDDVAFEGGWRLLSHWELCRLRYGLMPWDVTRAGGVK